MHALTGRRVAPLIVVSVLVVVLDLVAVAHAPSAQACDQVSDPNCVGVSAGSPGSSGGIGAADGQGSGVGSAVGGSGVSGASSNRGHSSSGGSGVSAGSDACLASQLAYLNCRQCQSLYAEYGGKVPVATLNGMLTASGCPPNYVAPSPAGGVPAAVVAPPPPPPPSPAVLAGWAASSFELPGPVVGRFPSGTMPDGRAYAIVQANTWFWTGASVWKPLSATARAGGNWATVTASPTTVAFTPGDGGAAVSCKGPGLVFDPDSDRYTYPGSWAPIPEPGGCNYVYRQSSGNYPNGEVTATLTITWELTWTGSGNTSGTLTHRSTSATAHFVVVELQSVVTG